MVVILIQHCTWQQENCQGQWRSSRWKHRWTLLYTWRRCVYCQLLDEMKIGVIPKGCLRVDGKSEDSRGFVAEQWWPLALLRCWNLNWRAKIVRSGGQSDWVLNGAKGDITVLGSSSPRCCEIWSKANAYSLNISINLFIVSLLDARTGARDAIRPAEYRPA